MQDDDSLLRSFVTIKPAAEKILSDGTAKYRHARTESHKYAKPHQRMLDFLLDDNSEDNAESEITAFMRERADSDTDSLAWWKDNLNLLFTTQYKLFTYQVMSCHIHDCYSVIVVLSFC
jgi:hypothetical protein